MSSPDNEKRLIAAEIIRQLWAGNNREQLQTQINLLLEYLDKAEKKHDYQPAGCQRVPGQG